MPRFLKLRQKRDKASPRFFQTTSKTKHNNSSRDSFKLLHKQDTRGPQECLKLLQKHDKESTRFFEITSKTKHKEWPRFFKSTLKQDNKRSPRFFQTTSETKQKESLELIQRQVVPEILPNFTSKTKYKVHPKFFFTKQTQDPRDAFKLLQKPNKKGPEMFSNHFKNKTSYV